MLSKVNPDWKRPDDWPYEEDWGSEEWEVRMDRIDARNRVLREKHGFIACPICNTIHTCKTVFCRECSYRAEIPA